MISILGHQCGPYLQRGVLYINFGPGGEQTAIFCDESCIVLTLNLLPGMLPSYIYVDTCVGAGGRKLLPKSPDQEAKRSNCIFDPRCIASCTLRQSHVAPIKGALNNLSAYEINVNNFVLC